MPGTLNDVLHLCRELDFMGSRYSDVKSAPADLDNITGEIKEIDGGVFRTMVAAGYAHLARHKDELNKINVFPIPDADTGNNMKIAMRAGVLNQLYEPEDNLQQAVAKFAEDALLSGQGNSGTVLSHFWITLSGELAKRGGKAKVPVAEFAEALEKVGATIHGAFPADKVKEGTIVSVVRKSTQLAAGGFDTLKDMVKVWEAQAKTALYETPDELEVDGVYVLKEARAKDPSIDSDSGAKGFWYITEGILKATVQHPVIDDVAGAGAIRKLTDAEFEPAAELYDGSEKHQYCTECVIELKDGKTKEEIEKALADPSFGDSMVVVSAPSAHGGAPLAKVHIHTDTPQKVFDLLTADFSATKIPIKEKVEDMRQQVEDSKKGFDADKFKVTFVVDSTSQVGHWAYKCYAHVPVVCMIRGEPFSCNIDPPNMNVIEFLNKTRHEEIPVGTAAPPIVAFQKVFEAALQIPDKPIIVYMLNKHMSVTHNNAVEAAKKFSEAEQARITIIDHGYMFGPSVPILYELLRAADKGYGKDQILQLFEEWRPRGYYAVFMNTTSVMRLVKHGRVPKEIGDKIGNLPDDMFCMPMGTSPDDGPAPLDYAACAGSLKNKIIDPIAGPNAKVKGYRAVLEKLRDSLNEGEVVRDFSCGEFVRADKTNAILDMAKEILGDKFVGPVLKWEPFLAVGAVSAWGGAFITYLVDDGKTSRPKDD